jgi:DNA-binding transcriptional LysR family regulator
VRVARSPHLRLVVDETVGELILKPHVAAFLTAHPSLSIEVIQRAWSSGGKRHDVDLALQYVPALSAMAGAEKLGEQRLLTCAAPQYLRERGLPHHPRDLDRHEGVVVSYNTAASSPWKFADCTQDLNVEIRKRAVVPSLSAALALTLGGAGVSQIPACWGIGYVRSGKLVRLLPEWEASLHLLTFEPRGGRSLHAASLLRYAQTLIEMGAPTGPC